MQSSQQSQKSLANIKSPRPSQKSGNSKNVKGYYSQIVKWGEKRPKKFDLTTFYDESGNEYVGWWTGLDIDGRKPLPENYTPSHWSRRYPN